MTIGCLKREENLNDDGTLLITDIYGDSYLTYCVIELIKQDFWIKRANPPKPLTQQALFFAISQATLHLVQLSFIFLYNLHIFGYPSMLPSSTNSQSTTTTTKQT